MGRPNKPSWHAQNRRFRCRVDGELVYFPAEIGRYDPPLIDGVPRAAWDWLHAHKSGVARRAVDLTAPTVFALVEVYLEWLDGRRALGLVEPPHYRAVCSHLALFRVYAPGPGAKATEERLAFDLSPDYLEGLAENLAARTYTAHYVADVCRSIQACFNWAARPVRDRVPVQLLAANPVKGYRPPRPPKVAEKYIDQPSLRAFLRWAWRRARAEHRGTKVCTDGHRYRAGLQRHFDLLFVRLLWFISLTGCRPGEAVSARWENLRWREGVMRLQEWKNAKSTGRAREIHLTPDVARLLRRIERLEGHHREWIFTHSLGKGQGATGDPLAGAPWNVGAMGKKIRDWRKAAIADEQPIAAEGAAKFVAYLLRHTYISDGLHGGASEAMIADLTGTSAQMISETYGHVQRSESAKLAAALAELRKARPR